MQPAGQRESGLETWRRFNRAKMFLCKHPSETPTLRACVRACERVCFKLPPPKQAAQTRDRGRGGGGRQQKNAQITTRSVAHALGSRAGQPY